MTSQQILALCRQAAEMGVKLNEGFSIREPEQLGMGIVFLGEIAYQLASHNEREAEEAPTQIVQRIREFEDRISVLEALDTGSPVYSMPSSANAEPTAQQPTPEANK
jgi:hypothetical protein